MTLLEQAYGLISDEANWTPHPERIVDPPDGRYCGLGAVFAISDDPNDWTQMSNVLDAAARAAGFADFITVDVETDHATVCDVFRAAIASG